MKTYHVRFTEADFDDYSSESLADGRTKYTWRTSVYDLYDNEQYTNYSVKRSPYGTDLLGNGVYTGINLTSSTSSEVGFVESGRFIDTSSRVDIIDWSVAFDQTFLVSVESFLNVYTSEDPTATPYYLSPYPDMVSDWSYKQNILQNHNIYIIDSLRYAFFELVFFVDSDVDISGKTVELLVSVDIDAPVVNGYFSSTRRMQDKFPEWMALREYDPSGEDSATPSSIGGQFLNAAVGEWITDLNSKIRYQEFQYHIDTVDLTQKAWVYVTQGVDDLIWSISGDGIQLARTADIEEFYMSEDADHAFFWNRLTNEIFTNVLYDELLINGVIYYQRPYHVWNGLDDIGVTVDLFRLQSATPNGYLEDNESFKSRILDVFKNRAGVHEDGIKLALRRELNLWRYWGSTPDSNFLGATPEIYEIEDLENDEAYFVDGVPTQEFKNLIQELSVRYPMTWGYFQFEKAFWDADGLKYHKGFNVLPRQLDATPSDDDHYESGVGDGNDLFVFKPKELDETVEFDVGLKIRGRRKTTRTEYTPLTFDVKVYGVAAEDLWDNPTVTGYFTLELTVIDNSATPASPSQDIYYCHVIASATNDIDYFQATPSSSARALIEWTTPDGYTDIAYQFRNKYTGELFDGQIDLVGVSKVTIYPGHYNGSYATPSYENAPTASTYKLWFDQETTSWMGLGGSSSLSKTNYDFLTHAGAFWFESQSVVHSGATPNTWQSDEYLYSIQLNGAEPDFSTRNYTLTLPTINWPASTSSRSIVVEILTQFGANNYGAFASESAATPIFLPSSYIAVDADTTWTSGYQKTFSTSTTSITFSTSSGSSYPILGVAWEMFEASLTTKINGKVDKNGPWRYGIAPAEGNTNFVLSALELDRNDFNIPQTTDYILSWIGIESVSNGNVIAWLDSNTVKPAVTYGGETNINFTYPDNAVVETLNDSLVYELSNFNLYVRLKPAINPKWNPKIHSGWFYDSTEDYYLYASPNTVSTTSSTLVLPGLNRQGAPIIVKAYNGSTELFTLRQVAFWDSTPSLVSYNEEELVGNDKNYLLTSYRNIYDITVTNITTGATIIPLSTSVDTNKVLLPVVTNPDYSYRITYKVAKSFHTDNEFVDTDGINKTKLFFDATPGTYGATSYVIDYEASTYDPATPIDVPLNTLYTSIDEGFIFIDHDVHDLGQVDVAISPSKVLADGYDYAVVTVKSYDINGNPKPYQEFNIFTNFGTLSPTYIKTDNNGFGYATLTTTNWSPSTPAYPATPILPAATPNGTTQGYVLFDGVIDARLGFEIQKPIEQPNKIVAVMASDYILANGSSATYIYGKVETPNHTPIPYAYVYWRKARSIYDVFTNVAWSTDSATPGSLNLKGRVKADANGRFSIGPFVSSLDSGYWVAAVETESASPSTSYSLIGDVVYWYEYPNVTNMLDPITGLPTASVQSSTPSWTIPTYTLGSAFPTSYDEDNPQPGYSAPSISWTPPAWYAIDKYKQYQMGLYGTTYDVVGDTPDYPDYKDS